MNCEQIESLLPAYLEADLTPDEMAGVKSHLSGCAGCREALAGFTELDGLLSLRRDEVPPAARTIKAVMPRVGFSRTKRFLDAVYSMPGIISVSFLIIGIVLFIYRRHVETIFTTDFSMSQFFTRLGEAITSGIMALSGGDVWVLTGLYAGVLLLILLGTGSIVFKFVRSNS